MQTAVKTTISEVVAEQKKKPSAGRRFAEAVATQGLEASVEFDTTITGDLSSLRRKPRFPARNMLKVVDLSREPRQYYWYETAPPPEDAEVTHGEMRRELANKFHKAPIPELLTTTAWVQVPPGLWEDADTFQTFLDYRLIMRLGTAENHTIILGDGGLLNMPDIERMTDAGPFGSTILAACNEVEQMGATADGLIINPADYYRLMAEGRLMQDVDDNGVFIVRTRLVEPGTAIIGDFGHGAQLFDAGRSVMRFAEPPPGTFAEPGIAVMAEIYERVVVNLPRNFFVLSL
jgi:hypothetical protein